MNVDRIKQLAGEMSSWGASPPPLKLPADVRVQPPMFTVAYSPKAPQKRLRRS
jgi:hypothetical protein